MYIIAVDAAYLARQLILPDVSTLTQFAMFLIMVVSVIVTIVHSSAQRRRRPVGLTAGGTPPAVWQPPIR